MSQEGNKPIRVRVEVEIPQGGGAVRFDSDRRRLFGPPQINLPQNSQSANARLDSLSRPVICASGTAPARTRYVFAQVFTPAQAAQIEAAEAAGDPAGDPPSGCLWVRPDSSGNWEFSQRKNTPELPVVALGTLNTLLAWSDPGSGAYGGPRDSTFTPANTGVTDCQGPGSGSGSFFGAAARLPLSGELARWATMARTWRFVISGATDFRCDNCSSLNGTWAVGFDDTQPQRCRWYQPLQHSFFGGQGLSIWRLQYQPTDGYWYLDCVSNLDQTPGTWISYRRHESAWSPNGDNELFLMTDSGYCSVPQKVTLTPI